jgi:hypothetical protein
VYKAKHSAFDSMRIPLGLGEFARETGSDLGVNAMRKVEAGGPTGNGRKP